MFIKSGRTLTSLRAISEALGAEIQWVQNKAVVKKDNTTIILYPDKKEILVNNVKKSIDVAPVIINKRMVVPIRFLAENLGAEVIWDNASKSVIIK